MCCGRRLFRNIRSFHPQFNAAANGPKQFLGLRPEWSPSKCRQFQPKRQYKLQKKRNLRGIPPIWRGHKMIPLDPICASARFPAASEKNQLQKVNLKKMDTPAYEHVNPGDPLAKTIPILSPFLLQPLEEVVTRISMTDFNNLTPTGRKTAVLQPI